MNASHTPCTCRASFLPAVSVTPVVIDDDLCLMTLSKTNELKLSRVAKKAISHSGNVKDSH